MNEQVEIDVIIATRGGRDCVLRALRSVLSQKKVSLKSVVVVENNSTDCSHMSSLLFDSGFYDLDFFRHVYLLNCRNANEARNFGVSICGSKYVAFLDSDDSFNSSHLHNSVSCLIHDNSQLCFSNFMIINGDERSEIKGSYSGDIESDIFITKSCDFRTSGIVVTRNAILSIPFDEALFKHQDWGLALDFQKHAMKLSFLHLPSFCIHLDSDDRMSLKTNQNASLYFAENKLGKARSYFIQSRMVDELVAGNHCNVTRYVNSGFYDANFTGFRYLIHLLILVVHRFPFLIRLIGLLINVYRRLFVVNK